MLIFRMAVAHIKSLRGITNTPPNDGTTFFILILTNMFTVI